MSSSSEDDVPLAARAAQVHNSNGAAAGPASNGAARNRRQPTPTSSRPASDDEDDSPSSSESESDAQSSDSDDDVPLSQRKKTPQKKKPAPKKQPVKRKREAASSEGAKRPKREGSSKGSGTVKWNTLVHSGVLFPPEYEPHGVKMLYDGKPVELTPDQEEVASMFAIMKETDYMKKPIFLKNFWEGFKEVRQPHSTHIMHAPHTQLIVQQQQRHPAAPAACTVSGIFYSCVLGQSSQQGALAVAQQGCCSCTKGCTLRYSSRADANRSTVHVESMV